MALNADIVEAVANSNFKTMSEQTMLVANTQAQNMAAHQGRMLAISEAAVGNIVKNLTEFDVGESAAIGQMIDSRLAPFMTAINGVLGLAQQNTKVAQTTPPVTP